MPLIQPIQRHQANFDRFCRHITRKAPPGPVPLAEYLVDWPIIEQVTGDKLPFSHGEEGLPPQAALHRLGNKEMMRSVVDSLLRFSDATGLDYLLIGLDTGLDLYEGIPVSNGTSGARRNWWFVKPDGPIQTREGLERFSWPRREDLDYSMLDLACGLIPDGMKILVQVDGILEIASGLMGMTRFLTALYDMPDLVEHIIRRATSILASQIETACEHDEVGGVWMGDDLGYSSGTFINPGALRQIFFPHYGRLVDITHQHGRPFLLHSCGNLEKIMDDLIRLGVDVKHSFEDKIMPVEEVYRNWGRRIGIIGGIDMDLMARGSPDDVRRRTRQVLDICGPNGGYALGTGNSVPGYVPHENYFAMIVAAIEDRLT
jgi:uroporphyrinogen decarboxylase